MFVVYCGRCVVIVVVCCCWFFFFKQKTAYEMRISDWSSDVCSSDLLEGAGRDDILVILRARVDIMVVIVEPGDRERLRLLLRQHAERHAGFHAHLAHALDHLDDRGHVAVLGVAPGGAHAKKTGRASGREGVWRYV